MKNIIFIFVFILTIAPESYAGSCAATLTIENSARGAMYIDMWDSSYRTQFRLWKDIPTSKEYLLEGGETLVIKETLKRNCKKKRKFRIKVSCKYETRSDTLTTDWGDKGQSNFNLGDLARNTDSIIMDCLPND